MIIFIKKHSIYILFFILIIIFFNSENLFSINDKKILKFGSEIFPPFSYYDKDLNYIGFSIELAKEITKKLDYEFENKFLDFNQILAGINFGIIDIGLDFMQTEERKMRFLFSDEYMNMKYYLLVKKNKLYKINSLADAVEKKTKFGLIPGALPNLLLKKYYKNSIIIEYNDVQAIFHAFKNGYIDGIINFKEVLNNFINSYSITEYEIIPIYFENEDLGLRFMFSKNNKDFFEKFNLILIELKKSGFIYDLSKKYNLLY